MLKKDNFSWNTTTKAAFKNMKQAMFQALVLALPNFTKEFVVECDA
jgi:hypothetical protein